MKVSASLYGNLAGRGLQDVVTLLDACHVDYLHFDCKDDAAVLADIGEVRNYSRTPIDLHLTAADPSRYFADIVRLRIARVSFQYEAAPVMDLSSPPAGTQYGLALMLETPVEAFVPYAGVCDFVLLMATSAGKQGQGRFSKQIFEKIHAFRRRFPGTRIHVKGGVNEEVGFLLRLLGVHAVVSGSFLVGSADIPHALLRLQRAVVDSNYLVQDFMLPLQATPQLSVSDAPTLRDVMQAIEQQGLGFICYIDPQTRRFLGISSNADVRRGILKHFHQLPPLSWQQLCNKSPVVVSPRSSLSEMMHLVRQQSFLVSFLPVVDAAMQLRGSMTFFHFIQSEI